MRTGATRRGEHGAAALEFALLFPLFLAIVFGVIGMGFGFNQKINLTQTAREASRYGATLSFDAAGGTIDDWLTKVTEVAISAAGGHDSGDLADDRAGVYVCVAYIPATGSASSLVTGTGGPGANQPCFTDGRSGENRVQVVVGSDTVVDFLLFGGKIHLASESVTHYEATS